MTDKIIEGKLVPSDDPMVLTQTPRLSESDIILAKEQSVAETPHLQPDTPIQVSDATTVVVQTDSHSIRDYAVMFRMHLYNGGSKVKGWVAFIKGRLSEKSTYVFLGAGVAAASALPGPWSFLSMGLSVVAAMVPDHVINEDGTRT